MIEVSAPGKLYIAGEYAVVETGHPAVIAAVDQFVTVTVESARKVGSIQSAQYSGMPVRWTRRNGELVLDIRENPFHYILAAIRLTEKYAQEKNILLSFYDLKVTSELDSSNGRKYGLGSSGAVTVATVKALNVFYALNLSQLEIFKIAALANLASLLAVMVAGSLSQPSTILGSKNKKLSILSVSYLPWIGQVYPLSH